MRTLTKILRFAALVLALGGLSVACGSDGEGGGGDGPPDLGGDGNDGNDNPDGNDDPDGTDNPDGNDGDGNPDGNDPDGDSDECPTPTTSFELLNSCAPAGVERRQFDNVQRLPENYNPNGPLPDLP